jgi:uncharacterized protein YidB (DUF937 family)
LSELVARMKQNGRGDLADSWVGTGPNKPLEHSEVESAIGPDVLATLAEKTGLSKDEISRRLSQVLPEAVNIPQEVIFPHRCDPNSLIRRRRHGLGCVLASG